VEIVVGACKTPAYNGVAPEGFVIFQVVDGSQQTVLCEELFAVTDLPGQINLVLCKNCSTQPLSKIGYFINPGYATSSNLVPVTQTDNGPLYGKIEQKGDGTVTVFFEACPGKCTFYYQLKFKWSDKPVEPQLPGPRLPPIDPNKQKA
jgi:hypothetical protein